MPSGDTNDKRSLGVMVTIFVCVAVGIVAAGFIHYRNYETHYRSAVENQLSAIADLKVGELVQWRKERLGDGGVLFDNAAFAALVRRFLGQPEDVEARRQLRSWFARIQTNSLYNRVFLVDPQGALRLSAPDTPEPPAAHLAQDVAAALRSEQVTFLDFHRDAPEGPIFLEVLAPILDASDANRPLGVVVLRIDPSTYLYPLIERWPAPSLTAETMLVRREGNEVVFLNELRFQKNVALTRRAPVDQKTLPAARAALGQEGVMEGIDYRGVQVVAALRTVPNSPWLLVARIDVAEIYAPLRVRLWQTAVLVGALLVGAGTSGALLWRQQRMRFYHERYKAAEALVASEVRYRRLFEAARDGILILDAETGMIVDVNPFLIEILGFSREEFLGKKVWELGPFKDIVASQDNFAELQQKEYIRYEDKALQTADGRRIVVEFVSNAYLVSHHKLILCNIRDITVRKRAEAQIVEQLDELCRWQAVMLGREDRNMQLKRDVNELLRRLGEPPRYPGAVEGSEPSAVTSHQ